MDGLPAVVTRDAVEEADFRMVTNPSNVILFPEGSSQGDKIAHLANTIPASDYGLPLFYIRSDFLPWDQIADKGYLTHDELQVAAVPLSYTDGYPVTKSGEPFWTRLPHEPHPDYILFQEFLALAESEGIRLIDSLAKQQQVALERIRELSNLYFWSSRARAYDLFIVAADAKKREVRTRKTEAQHFDIAGGILDTIITRINDEPDLIKKMDATDLFDLFEKMVKVQRLSLGLTGANASTLNQMPNNPGQTVEVILRSLTQSSGLTTEAGQDMQKRLALLMSDPDTAMKAQELVIRATTNNEVHQGA